MVVTIAASFVAGIALGAFFRVWVLIPATLAILVALALSWRGESSAFALIGWVGAVVALQLGFGGGAALQSAQEWGNRERAQREAARG